MKIRSLSLASGLIAVLCSTAAAQFNDVSSSANPFPAAAGATYVVTGDFNQDGVLDTAWVTSTENGSGAIKVYISNGPTYAQGYRLQTYSSGNFPLQIIAADLNGDGMLDLAVANSHSNSVTLLTNYGGGFSTSTISNVLPTGGYPGRLAAGDFTGDGYIDLAVGDINLTSGARVQILANHSNDGTFNAASLFSNLSASAVWDMEVADLDGDGCPDLIVSSVQKITVFGCGQYQPGSYTFSGINSIMVAVADFDGDGKPDLAISQFNSTVHFLRNTSTGPGNLSFSSPWPEINFSGYSYGIAAADFNRDGKPDLVGYFTDGTIALMIGDGAGNFTKTSYQAGNSNFTIAIGDLNGDGLTDVVAVGTPTVLLNTAAALKAPRQFTMYAGAGQAAPAAVPVTVGTYAGGSTGFSTASTYIPVNTPSFLSVPASGTTGTPVSFTANTTGLAAGTYKGKVAYSASGYSGTATNVTLSVAAASGKLASPTTMTSQNQRRTLVADINGDGKPDILTFGDQIVAQLNTGSGTYTTVASYSDMNYSDSVALLDLNGDGKLDLVSFNVYGNRLSTHLGDGAGNFTYGTQVPVPGLPPAYYGSISLGSQDPGVITGDFNGDGRTDLVIRSGGVIAMLLNDGHGHLAFAGSRTVFGGPYNNELEGGGNQSMAVGDFDNDGNLDLALEARSQTNQRVYVLKGDGSGGFSGSYYVGLYGLAVASGDVNGDGVTDFIVLTSSGPNVYFGGSSFPGTPVAAYTLSSLGFGASYYNGANWIETADINGDGKLDILVSNPAHYFNGTYIGGDIIAALSDGAGGFSTRDIQFPNSTDGCGQPTWFAPADLDGDGRVDILSAYGPLGGCTTYYLSNGAMSGTTATLTTTGGATAIYGATAPVSLAVAAGANGLSSPTGDVALYRADNTALATATRAAGGPWTFAGVPAGSYSGAKAVYSGDIRNNSSTSNTVNFTVTQATGTLVLSSPVATNLGDSATFTATLSPVSSLGTITFKDGSTTLGTGTLVSPGVWMYSTTALTVGTHSITAVLSGDANVTAPASSAISQVVNKASATVNFSNLSQAYNGGQKTPTVTTFPTGKTVNLTYVNGVCPSAATPTATAPSAVGSYCVTGTVSDSSYTGTGTATLVITQGTVTISITNTSQNYDGSPKPVTVSLSPNVAYSLTYAGSSTAPSAVGTYAVHVAVTDSNYTGTADATLDIHTTPATVTVLTNNYVGTSVAYGTQLQFPVFVGGYSGSPMTGSIGFYVDGTLAQTYTPTGSNPTLNTTFSVTPTGGIHTFTATYNASHSDPNNATSTSSAATVSVFKQQAQVTLGNLSPTYTGSTLSATATVTGSNGSVVPGIRVDLTYNGGGAPTNAGSYAVVGTINDTNYSGSISGTFTINKAAGSIVYTGVSGITYDGTQHLAAAVPTPNVAVTLAYAPISGGTPTAIAPTNAGTYTVTATNANYTFPSGTLLIGKKIASLTVGNLNSVVSPGGTANPVTVVTSPAGLSYQVLYDDYLNPASPSLPVLPSGAKSFMYRAVATITDPNYTGSATGVMNVHTRSTTNLSLTVPATVAYNTSVVLTAQIGYSYVGGGAKATGLVTFTMDGSTALGSSTMNASGIATIRTGFDIGSHTIQATYAGDVDNSASTSNSATFTTAKGTLVVSQTGAAGPFVYDGTPKSLSFTTNLGAANVPLKVLYDGSATLPTSVGTHSVTAVVDPASPYYTSATVTATLVIQKGVATVTLGSLSQPYLANTARSATATTNPAGLRVDFAYAQNGQPATPINPGSYTVTATINDNYTGTATGTLTITNATGQITIGNLNQNANPAGNAVTVTTVPANLNYTLTYNGTQYLPTTGGTYTVVATINDSIYTGSTTATLVVNQSVNLYQVSGSSQVLLSADGVGRFSNTPFYLAPGTHSVSCTGISGIPGSTTQTTFSSWTDGGAATHQITVGSQPLLLGCSADVAVYETATAGTGGTVLGGGTFYPVATIWTVTAVPNPGYMFSKWTFQGNSNTSTVNPLLLNVSHNGPDYPVANFIPAYTVTTGASPAGAGTVTGGGTFPMASPNFTVSASSIGNYKFDHWSFTGASVVIPPGTAALAVAGLVNQATQTFTANASAVTMVANYIPLNPILNVSIGTRSTDVGSGYRIVLFNATNSGNAAASNARITDVHVTAIQTVTGTSSCVFLVDPVPGPAAAALLAAASGGACSSSISRPTVAPLAGYLPASFGTIGASGGKGSAAIYFDWGLLATKVTMDVTYTRDGGTPATVSITTLR